MKIKKLVFALSALFMCFMFTGCSEIAKFGTFKAFDNVKTFNGTVAENENYIFDWEEKNNRVILKSKQSGETVWSSVPERICNSSKDNSTPYFAPIAVSYLEPTTNQVKMSDSAAAIENVSVEKTDNKLKVYYSLDSIEICVPVTYSLENDGFSVEINSKELTEGKYKLYQIALLPYNVSTENSKENWLFIPYGSGALMYTDDNLRTERKFEEDVYGIDYSVTRNEVFNNDTAVKMPVFAAGNSKSSVFAVIESGAEYATVKAVAGNKELKYSNITPSFRLRGYNTTNVQYSGKTGQQIVRISDTKVDDKFKVKYHLINGEKNFVKMAEIYREYLNKTYGEQKQDVNNSIYLSFLGGAGVVEYTAGIKHTIMKSATTYSQASDIIGDFKSEFGTEPIVGLTGFGNDGVEIGQVAGNYKFNPAFGSKKDLKSLLNDNKVLIDYELIKYCKSGSGFSPLWDSSKNANNGTAKQYEYDLATKVSDKKGNTYRLLRRDMISDAAEKLLKNSKKSGAFGFSTGSIGNTAYSDYSSAKYTSKGCIDEDVSKILKKLSDNGKCIAVSDANDYAAATSNVVLDTPLDCGTLACLDESIPFYAMVFKGYTKLYSKSVNLSDDAPKVLLDSLSSGAGIQYTLCNNADSLRDSYGSGKFAKSVYSDIKTDMKDTANIYLKLLDKISASKITDWYKKSNGVTVTTFDNQIKIYSNYSDKTVTDECGQIPSMGFIYTEGR